MRLRSGNLPTLANDAPCHPGHDWDGTQPLQMSADHEGRQSMTDRCPDTFLRDRPKCRGLDFLRQWLNLFRLLSPWRPRYLLVTRSASRRASGLGCSFAHFGAMISETSTSKDLTSMTETNDI